MASESKPNSGAEEAEVKYSSAPPDPDSKPKPTEPGDLYNGASHGVTVAAVIGTGLLGLRFGRFQVLSEALYVSGIVTAVLAWASWSVRRLILAQPADERRVRPARLGLLSGVFVFAAATIVLSGLVVDLMNRPPGSDSGVTEEGGDGGTDDSEAIADGTSSMPCSGDGCGGGTVTVDLGGLWLVNPLGQAGGSTTNEAGRALLATIVEAIGQPQWLTELRLLSAEGADVLTDNVGPLLENVVKPAIEGLFALDDGAGDAELGPDVLQQTLILISEHPELGQLPDSDQVALAIAIQEGLTENSSTAEAFSGSAATNQTTVIVVNDGRGMSHVKRSDR